MVEILEERYEVREDGIYHIVVIDCGDSEETIENLVISKDVFVEALKLWGDNNG